MTNKGVISFKFTDIISDSVEIGDFVWKIDRQRCTTTIYERCDGITCKPKDESPTVLWNCLVVGTLAIVNKKHGVQRGHHWWSHLYGNNLTICDVHHKKERVSKALVAVSELDGKDVSGEVHVEIVDSFIIDLSDPKNALIEDPDDAAKLKVGEHELWLPKKHLACKSPFFADLFKNNFKEGADSCYDLTGLVELEEFLQFVGIVHDIDVPVGKNSVEGLLHLADLFQCKVVRRRCEDFIRTDKVFSLSKKLVLGERFKLNTLLVETVGEISADELKKVHLPSGVSHLLVSLMAQKLRLMDP